MARTVRDTKLGTRTARRGLEARSKPYYRELAEGLHLGYRASAKPDRAGKWVMRRYAGDGAYKVETVAMADDVEAADGRDILDFDLAQDRVREISTARKAAEKGTAKVGPYLVSDAMTDYLAWVENGGRDAGDSRSRSNAHIIPTLGGEDTATLTTEQIEKWHSDLAKSGRRLRTKPGEKQKTAAVEGDEAQRKRRANANRVLTILKAALNLAFEREKISTDAAWRRVKPFRKADATRVRYLQKDEARRLINGCAPDFRKMVQAALLTGCRYSELARLTVTDFNPDSGTVHIAESKSGKERHVVLTTEGAAFFSSLTAGRDGGSILFLKDDGGRWHRSHQSRPMTEANERASIDPPATFHVLRHTYCSHALMAGMHKSALAANLGHADTRMIDKHYGHLEDQWKADMIRSTAPVFGIEVEDGATPLRAA